MGMLEKAKADKSDDTAEAKGKDGGDSETHKKHKKKGKHPASSVSEQPDADEGEEAEADGGAQQPDSEADEAPAQAQPQGSQASEQPQGQGGQQDQDAGDGDADNQPPQQGGAQGAQGASPVPSPAAPGAGDTTSGGDDTPDQGDDQGPNAQPPETPGDDTAAGPGSESNLTQVPMSPGLKDEYDKANELLMQLLYKSGDDQLAMNLVKGLMPQGPGKIKNAATLAITVVTQIHKRMELPPQIILPFAKDVTAHILDLGQQVKQIQYSDQESTAILGAVYEGCLRVFGVTKQQTKNAAQHLGRAALQGHAQKYQEAHAHAKSAIDANNAQFHHPHLAPQQGAPGEAGPQTGAPSSTQGSPTTNASPQPPVPQQGMLSAAAQQPPEGEQSNG